ncbi:MAG: SDR family NAD(P)-dependent oxidoreductase [Bacteroidota bacterium]
MSKIFITGSSDGLGLLAARSLVSKGHTVFLHARNEERARVAASGVPGAEKVLVGDFASMEETKRLAEKVNALGPFDSVIHNAGIYEAAGAAKSRDGWPLIFAVNTLAPYLLTALISPPQRLIYLSSGLHRQGDARPDRLQAIMKKASVPTYSDTKLHDLILAVAVARLWPAVISNAVDPGWVPTKMGGKNAPDDLDRGYETQVWLASSDDPAALQSGRLLHHLREVSAHPQAGKEDIAEKFLEVCAKITGIPFPFSNH